jgi:hypothetical protein
LAACAPVVEQHTCLEPVVIHEECSRPHELAGDWTDYLLPEEMPSERTLVLVSAYMEPWPDFELNVADGLWLADRIEKGDWKQWGRTVHEAITFRFGL